MKTSKCMLFQRQVTFVGHIVSEEEYHLNADHALLVKKHLKAPSSNIGEVRLLLGLVEYFRRHAEHFSKITKPLNDLLTKPVIKGPVIPSPIAISWGVFHLAALEKLIVAITEPPILAFLDFELAFALRVYASG